MLDDKHNGHENEHPEQRIGSDFLEQRMHGPSPSRRGDANTSQGSPPPLLMYVKAGRLPHARRCSPSHRFPPTHAADKLASLLWGD
ncbi:hypothetical protein [uncultured Bradyrhizobium sp.]|uniref:hypothetical protein n=1 Tax=uncultured Bradyrhizobium sp. TaxID=199684 RepID=UPI002624CFFB|nr:hypothetical protein [uncultured Bradyrhizobium sp.]